MTQMTKGQTEMRELVRKLQGEVSELKKNAGGARQ